MGLFKNLMNSIFHAAGRAEAPPDAFKPGQVDESRVQAAQRQGVPVAQAVPGAPAPATAAKPAPAAVMEPVDVETTLNNLAAKNPEKLDWKHSIVDLMKLVGMDSSLASRKELAEDLKYTGDMNDSATMNMWLHKQVMKKLAENGGKIPQDLLT